jgi:hypothetical protein
MCRVLLATNGAAGDAPSVLGEVAHIVAQSPGGPRAGEVTEVDAYDNLILLCSIDHKRIDDQVSYFTRERLRAIKIAHETWVLTQGETLVLGRPPTATAAPAPALSLALNIHMSEEAVRLCALLLAVLVLAALASQARAA